jgi:hypothetical protein
MQKLHLENMYEMFDQEDESLYYDVESFEKSTTSSQATPFRCKKRKAETVVSPTNDLLKILTKEEYDAERFGATVANFMRKYDSKMQRKARIKIEELLIKLEEEFKQA